MCRLRIFYRKKTIARNRRVLSQKKVLYLNKLDAVTRGLGAGVGARKQLKLIHSYFVKNRLKRLYLTKQQLLVFKGRSFKALGVADCAAPTISPRSLTNVFRKYGVAFAEASTLCELKKRNFIVSANTSLVQFTPRAAATTPLTNITLLSRGILNRNRANTLLLADNVFRLGAKQRTLIASNIEGIEKLQHVYKRQTAKRQKHKLVRRYRKFYTKTNKFGKVKLFNKTNVSRSKSFLATTFRKSYYITRKAAIFKRRVRMRRKKGKRKYSKIKHRTRMRRRRLRKGRLVRKFSRKRRSYLLGRVRAKSTAWAFVA